MKYAFAISISISNIMQFNERKQEHNTLHSTQYTYIWKHVHRRISSEKGGRTYIVVTREVED